MASSIEIISAKDYNAIELLLNEKFYSYNNGLWYDRFNHWFEQNPAFSSEDIRGYCIKDEEVIKGVIFTIPSNLTYEKATYKAINISTWYVEAEYRNKSLNLLHKAINHDVDLIFSTSIVSDQMKTTEMFGFQKYLALEKINARMIPFNPINIGLFSLLKLTISIPIFNSFFQKVYISFKNNSKFDLIKGLSENHDEFINRLNQNIITNDRSSETISWLIRSPFRKVFYFGIYQNGKQIGMMLWKFISDKLKTFECIDFIIIDSYKSKVLADMNSILKQIVSKLEFTIDILIIPETSGINEFSTIAGLPIKRQQFNNKYFLSKSAELSQIINKKQFYFTNQGDMNL